MPSPMKKAPYLDDEEREIVEAYERGEYVIAEDDARFRAALQQAAKNYLKKTARVNIRISQADLRQLKVRAAEEWLPYQTLMASVLHKYASGRLPS